VARRLALIAHDDKKVDFVAWATFNRETLSQFELIGTRHTARLVRDKVGVPLATNLGTADVIITALLPHAGAPRGAKAAA
jgi:methylglyoxal synthase